jgi:radical SAM superfamily enzyme with C-terminal helix-hairpin-helix motif
MSSVLIVDGYVDEPSCLGVPPYISPYPRYIYGAIKAAKSTLSICYKTIDQLRNSRLSIEFYEKFDIIIVIAGMIVPGRYLSGYPMSPREVTDFFSNIARPIKILCGPAARYGFGLSGGIPTRVSEKINNLFDLVIQGDPDIVINQLIVENMNINAVDPEMFHHSMDKVAEYASKGANIVSQHPFYPDFLLAEIETFRGCSRSIVGGCSFCSEPAKGLPRFREIKDIASEIKLLYQNGVKHFRLGNQPCFFSYKAFDADREEFPRPNPVAIEKLLKGVRCVAPNLKTLHIDNANPGVLARYPEESIAIAKSIIRYHTSGDVAAFGVESVDPVVIEKNNLKACPEDVFEAVRILNEVGSIRGNSGLPELLPGLNFVFGLPGETKKTYSLALEFLQQILHEKLLVRRINIRQVIPLPGTPLEKSGLRNISRHKSLFQHFKSQVRRRIEKPLLMKLMPKNTLIKNLYTECYDGNLTFARQLGSYPLLVGIPGKIPLKRFLDAKIVDYGYRSVTAIPFPLDINTVPIETIETLPGIGKKRAVRIVNNRPILNYKKLADSLDDQSLIKELKIFLGDELLTSK